MSDSDSSASEPLLYQGLRKIHRLPALFKHLGVKGALRYIAKRLRLLQDLSLAVKKQDVIGAYRFLEPPHGAHHPIDLQDVAPRTLQWAIPHFEPGSGGHMTIFRMVWYLEQLGYASRIVVVGNTYHDDGAFLGELIRKHFMPVAATVAIGEDKLQPAELTIATSWETAYYVRRFAHTRHKLYFIQDMEPWFFAASSQHAFAEATYRFGFIGITAGPWLAEQARGYGMEAYPFEFSYDKEHHQPQPRMPGPRRVFFYARHVTPRRGFELGLLALERVYRELPDVEFVLAGWDVSGYVLPFPHLNAGVVAHEKLAELYSQCDAALVLSLTNVSLLPLELMACGCPVVSNRGPNVEWQLRDGFNAVLADATPEDLAEALVRVLSGRELRERLIHNGLEYARATDWGAEAGKVAAYIERIRGRAR